MVTIDENGNKVNVWTESRIDTATLEIMEMKHTKVSPKQSQNTF